VQVSPFSQQNRKTVEKSEEVQKLRKRKQKHAVQKEEEPHYILLSLSLLLTGVIHFLRFP